MNHKAFGVSFLSLVDFTDKNCKTKIPKLNVASDLKKSLPTGRTNNGVCTKWLQPMIPDDNGNTIHRVPAYVRRSQFRLPNRVQTPVIMIGPGTGLAPFR